MPAHSRWRAALAAATVSLIAAAPLVTAEQAFAEYPPVPSLQITSATVLAGTSISFNGYGFEPGEQVQAQLEPNGPVLGTFTADAQGTVSGRVRIPRGTQSRTYLLTLTGVTSGNTASVRLIVRRAVVPPRNFADSGPSSLSRLPQGSPSGAQQAGEAHEAANASRGDQAAPSQKPAPRSANAQLVAKTDSSDATVALIGLTGALVVFGGGSVVLARRRNSDTGRG